METVKVGLLGCGGIPGAHGRALRELWESAQRVIEVVAACDVDEERARALAGELEEIQGTAPAVFTDMDKMLSRAKGIEAVDICTQHVEHHSLAIACLEEGKDVIIEKPLAITLRAGKSIMDAARQAQRILAVAENYRRSPHERANRWAVATGRIGTPRTFYWQSASHAMGKWAWRNFKQAAGGGWLLDGGVHHADLFRYQLGSEAQQVFATVRLYEPYRYDEPETRTGAWNVDVEDATFAQIHFDNNVVVLWSWQGSAPGAPFDNRVLYGSEGCLHWQSGLWLGNESNTQVEALVDEFMASIEAEEKERLFPGGVINSIATELHEFAVAVRERRVPEVDGVEGYKALALCMAVFESAQANRTVSVREIEQLELEAYQQDINDAIGLGP